jgi:NDP-sugar pyrophosphorylase family protein
MTTFTEEEKRMLWVALNNMQHYGVKQFAKDVEYLPDKVRNDWTEQTVREYDVINVLKQKILGD